MTTPQPVNNPSIVWTRFVVAFARLLSLPMREEAAYRGEAFTTWQNSVLSELGSQGTTDSIASSLQALLNREESQVAARLMLEELDAFTTYVERLTGTPIDPDTTFPEQLTTYDRPAPQPGEVKEGLGVASIIFDSLADLFDKLPFAIKAIIKAAKEAASIAGFHF